MDILTYIQRDHRKVARMLTNLLDINLSYVRMTLFNEMRAELTLHAESEAATFYRALEAEGNDDLSQRMAEAERDHAEIERLLDIVGKTPVSSDVWMETFGELKHAVEHHVAEEENIIFPRARVLLNPGRLRELGREMDRTKFLLRNEMQAPAE